MQASTKKIVGLTGGIGSGKTTVAKMFMKLGVPVYFADNEAKNLMQNNAEIKTKLVQAFGNETFEKGKLNRAYLAEVVFNSKSALKKINSIVHPVVKEHFKNWTIHQNAPYVIQENAILFENKSQGMFDKIITVTAPIMVKINRVRARDNVTEEMVLSRMKNQLPDEFKMAHSDYIIENTDLELTQKKVLSIHQKLSS